MKNYVYAANEKHTNIKLFHSIVFIKCYYQYKLNIKKYQCKATCKKTPHIDGHESKQAISIFRIFIIFS